MTQIHIYVKRCIYQKNYRSKAELQIIFTASITKVKNFVNLYLTLKIFFLFSTDCNWKTFCNTWRRWLLMEIMHIKNPLYLISFIISIYIIKSTLRLHISFGLYKGVEFPYWLPKKRKIKLSFERPRNIILRSMGF